MSTSQENEEERRQRLLESGSLLELLEESRYFLSVYFEREDQPSEDVAEAMMYLDAALGRARQTGSS